MFLALFLTPWVVMYALSTIVMHHRVLLTGHKERIEPAFEAVETRNDYRPEIGQDASLEDVALSILQDVGLEGAFSVRGNLESGRLTVLRNRPVGSQRIVYDPSADTLRIEKQQFGWAYFLEMLHRRRGYADNYLANTIWAVLVDIVVVAIVLWAVTGLWMWLEMSRTRWLGCAFLASGLIIFCLLMSLL
jgi:hypothetical protein